MEAGLAHARHRDLAGLGPGVELSVFSEPSVKWLKMICNQD
jgi:hypothetical protein